MNNYSIFDFNLQNLNNCFSNDINERVDYLFGYLTKIECKSIILEKEYIDKDYIMDYQDFYSRCYHDYPKFCKRAHFFSYPLSNSFIEKVISSETNYIERDRRIFILRNSYLGFSVIKPVPHKKVGKTCLKTFEGLNKDRKYLAVKKCHANLFGIELELDSLPFQEQDTIMAACATISLWCSFQKTSQLFTHYLPSPGEITKGSTIYHLDTENRVIPSKGLTVEQIIDGIRNVGLNYEIVTYRNRREFLGTIYAYLKMQLPIILGISNEHNDALKSERHAVTLVGYRLGNNKKTNHQTKANLISENITRLYAHDDQNGAFSRIFLGDSEDIQEQDIKDKISKNIEELKEKASDALFFEYIDEEIEVNYPKVLIIPLYHKIRINSMNVLTEIDNLTRILDLYDTEGELKWDIYLSSINELKKELINNNNLKDSFKINLLSKCMPKYVWICKAICGNDTLLTVLLDSTDISASDAFLEVIIEEDKKDIFEQIKNIPPTKRNKLNSKFYDLLMTNLD